MTNRNRPSDSRLWQHVGNGLAFGVAMSVLLALIWLVGGDPIIESRGSATADVRIAIPVFLVGSPLAAVFFTATSGWHRKRFRSFLAALAIVAPLSVPMVIWAIGGHAGPGARVGAAVTTTVLLAAVLAHAGLSD